MHKITINCEKLNHPNTGLYHYCANLSKALLAATPADYRLQVYAPASAAAIYPPGTFIIPQHGWHKLFNPASYNCNLWHATNQEKSYFPTARSVKKILTVHDLNYFNDPSKPLHKRTRYLRNIKSLVRRSSHLICISAYTLQELQKHMAINLPHNIIYNGCNIDFAVPETKPALQLPAPFIFTIGTITNKKNFHVLPALLVGNHYLLVIAGDIDRPAYQQKIIATAKQLGVADRVIFTGGITEGEKHWYYRNCLAFAFPSLHEGFGLPVVEAMAFGKPLFLSTHTSLPEVGGPDAFYFEHFDPVYMNRLFTEKLNYFNANKMVLKQNLLNRAVTFSWTEAARQHWEIYTRVLNS